jgi:hypothetical protein
MPESTITLGGPPIQASLGGPPQPQPTATPFDPNAFLKATQDQQNVQEDFDPKTFIQQADQAESSFNPDEFVKKVDESAPSMVINAALQGDANVHPAQIATAESAQFADQSPQEKLWNGMLGMWQQVPDWHHLLGSFEDGAKKIWNLPLEWNQQLMQPTTHPLGPPMQDTSNAYLYAKTGDPKYGPWGVGLKPATGPEEITELPASALKVGEQVAGLAGKEAELSTPYPGGPKSFWAQAVSQAVPGIGPFMAPEIGKKVAEATGEATEATKQQYNKELTAVAEGSDIVRQQAMEWANAYQKYMDIDPNSLAAQIADNGIWFLAPAIGPEAEIAELISNMVAKSARYTVGTLGLGASYALPAGLRIAGAATVDTALRKYFNLPEGTAAVLTAAGVLPAELAAKGGMGRFLSNQLHKAILGSSQEDFRDGMKALLAHGDLNVVDSLQYKTAQELNEARQDVADLTAAGKDTSKADKLVKDLEIKHDSILNQRWTQQFMEDWSNRAATAAVNTGVGAMAGATFGYGAAPTGEEAPYMASGAAGGAAIVLPFAVHGAWRSQLRNRANYGARVFEGVSKDAGFDPDYGPYVGAAKRAETAQTNGLIRLSTRGSPDGEKQLFVKRGWDLLNAAREQLPDFKEPSWPEEAPQPVQQPGTLIATPQGLAPAPPPVPRELRPMPKSVLDQLPDGFVGKDGNAYSNGDRINNGVALHESRHISQMIGGILRAAKPELMERFGNTYDALRGIPQPGARGFTLMPETRSTPEYLRAERDADIGRLVLKDKPIGLLYGGERPGDVASRWARQLLYKFMPEKLLPGPKFDPLLGTPSTGQDRVEMLRQLYRDGALAQKNRFLREPVAPSAQPPAAGGAAAPPAHPFDPFSPDEQAVGHDVMRIATDPKTKGTPIGVKFTPENVAAAIQEAKDNGVEVNFQNIADRVIAGPSQRPPVPQGPVVVPQPKPEPQGPVVAPQPPQPEPQGPGVVPAAPHPADGYESARIRGEDAMRQKLINSKRADKEAVIARAGIEEAAKDHAKVVGPDSDLITWRTNKYNKSSIWGTRTDANDPFHQMIMKRANLSDEASKNLADIEANMGKPITVDYEHAPGEGGETETDRAEREAARRKAGAPQRVAGEGEREILTKSFVPTSIEYFPLANVFQAHGFSPDKFTKNAQIVIGEAKRMGYKTAAEVAADPEKLKGSKLTFDGVHDPLIVQYFHQTTENYQNGYSASGDPIKGATEIKGGKTVPVVPNPDYTPHVIPRDYRDQINAMMGNTSAKTGQKALAKAAKTGEKPVPSPEQAAKQELAKQNYKAQPYFNPETGEVNKFRKDMGADAAAKLSPVATENLDPNLIKGDVREGAALNDYETLRPSGYNGDRGQFAAKGVPKSEYVASALMPSTAQEGEFRPTPEEIEQGRARGRIGSPGLWDTAQTAGHADELAAQLGVDPKKRFWEQKPENRQKIQDYYKWTGQAQYMPATAGYDPAFKQPEPVSDDVLRAALSSNKVPFVGTNRDLPAGTPISSRIDIPSFLRSGIYAQTIHAPKIGKNLGYDSIVRMKGPVTFTVRESTAEKIKNREMNKAPIAATEGKYDPDRTLPADINDLSKWTPLGFDPMEHSYFYDKTSGEPVIRADEAIHIGNTVYVKNPVYGQSANFRYMPSTAPQSEEFNRWSRGAPVVLDSAPFDPGMFSSGLHLRVVESGVSIVDRDGNVVRTIRDAPGTSAMGRASYVLGRLAEEARLKAAQEHAASTYQTGRSVVVGAYHGTPNKDFTVFEPAMMGSYTGAPSAEEGFFFAGKPDTAQAYTIPRSESYRHSVEEYYDRYGKMKWRVHDPYDNVVADGFQSEPEAVDTAMALQSATRASMPRGLHEVFVRFENPLVHDFGGDEYREKSYYTLIKQAKDEGRDGAIFTNTYDGGGQPDNIFVTFRSNDIKSTANMAPTEHPDIHLMPSTARPERLDRPAIMRKEDEKVFPAVRAGMHAEIPDEYPIDLADYFSPEGYKRYVDGYVDQKGVFHSKEGGYDVAQTTGQIVKPTLYGGEVQSNELALRRALQQGHIFASPNEKDVLTWEEALENYNGPSQDFVNHIGRSIDQMLGLDSLHHDAIGDTKTYGTENTVVSDINNVRDFDELRYAAALRGRALNQKSVLAFWDDKGGKNAMYYMMVPEANLPKIRGQLDDAGLEFRTLRPHENQTLVQIYAKDPEADLAALHKLASVYSAQGHDITIQRVRGTGEFVGEADTREEAQRNYAKIISDYEGDYPDRRRGTAEGARGADTGAAAQQGVEGPAPPGGPLMPSTARPAQTIEQARADLESRGGKNYPEYRISTRFPQGRDATEDFRTQQTDLDVESIYRDKAYSRKIANDVREFLPKELQQRDWYQNPIKQIESAIEFFKENKQAHYEMMQQYPWAQRAIKQYEGYNIWAHQLAEKYGYEIWQVLGGESAISPQTPPDQSFAMIERLMRVKNEGANVPWDERFDKTIQDKRIPKISDEDLQQLQGKTFNDLDSLPAGKERDLLRAKWARVYDQTFHDPEYHVITPEGAQGDLAMTTGKNPRPVKSAWRSYGQIARGLKGLEAPTHADLADILTKAKVSSYYNSKMAPNEMLPDYVVDTHDIGSSWLHPVPKVPDIDKATGKQKVDENGKPKVIENPRVAQAFNGPSNKGLGHHGVSALHAEAGRRAAAEYGLVPSDFQAGIWSHQQGALSADVLPLKTIAEIDKVWKDASRGKYTAQQAREKAFETARDALNQKFGSPNARSPTWARELEGPSGAIHAGAGNPSDAEELPGGIGAGAAAGSGGGGYASGGVAGTPVISTGLRGLGAYKRSQNNQPLGGIKTHAL